MSLRHHAFAHLVGAAWWRSLSTCCRHAVVPLAPCLATRLFSFKGKRSSSCHFSDGIGLTGCQLRATSGFMHVGFLATTSSNTGGWIHVLIVPPHHGWHECFARGAISHGALAHEGLAYESLSHDGLAHEGLARDGLAHGGLANDGLAHDTLAQECLAQ